MILIKGVQLKGVIKIETTIEDVMLLFGCHTLSQIVKENRLKYGPWYSFRLESLIKDIQTKCMGLNIEEVEGNKILNFDQAHAVRARAFNDIMEGKIDTPIFSYSRLLSGVDMNYTPPFKIDPNFIYEIAVGAGYGTIYYGLFSELENIKKCVAEDQNIEFNNIELPDISDSAALRMGLLLELGILDSIKDISKDNFSKAGRIIEQLSGIDKETAKKVMQAIYYPNSNNKRNHPFNNLDNEQTISEILIKLKINKIDKEP